MVNRDDGLALPQGSLLVGIANPATMPRLMRLGADVAATTGRDLVATHVVAIENRGSGKDLQVEPDLQAANDLLRQAVGAVEDTDIGVDTFVEVADTVHEGLIEACIVENAGLLLVGYSDDIPGNDKAERAFDRIMHRVARGVSCDLVVAKFRTERVERVLVPIACDANLRVSAAFASALARRHGATVRFVHIVEPGANPRESDICRQRWSDWFGLDEIGDFEVISAARPAAQTMEEVNKSDLAIIGTALRPSLSEAIFGSLPERIAAHATSSVLLVRAAAD